MDRLERGARLIPLESHLIAQHWNTEAQLIREKPSLSLFAALQKLQQHHKVYITTHGVFDKKQPLQSGLSLFNQHAKDKDKMVDLPLWVCNAVRLDNCELLILSACETATATLHSEGRLSDPFSIATNLAASGVSTVIATLSRVDNFPSLIFIDDLLTLADKHPTKPWHQLLAETREQFKYKTEQDRQALKARFKTLLPEKDKKQIMNFPLTLPDMQDPKHWANFVVIGAVERKTR